MKEEFLVGQRQLVGLTVRRTDGSWYAKYVFPFFDTRWKVHFLLVDVMGEPPRMWQAPATLEGREIRIAAKAGDVPLFGSVSPDRLRGLLHLDPWWALKGGPRIPDELRATAVATNIASRVHALDVPRRVRDVVFDTAFERVLAVDTEDERFRRKSFQEGELDVAKLLPTSS